MPPDADLGLKVNGWIGNTRGTPISRELMRRLARRQRRIAMIATDWTDGETGQAVFDQPNVRFDGEPPTDGTGFLSCL